MTRVAIGLSPGHHLESWTPWAVLVPTALSGLAAVVFVAVANFRFEGAGNPMFPFFFSIFCFIFVFSIFSYRVYTVRVSDTDLLVGFGSWFMRRRIPLNQIRSAERVTLSAARRCRGPGMNYFCADVEFMPDWSGEGVCVRTDKGTTTFRSRDPDALLKALHVNAEP